MREAVKDQGRLQHMLKAINNLERFLAGKEVEDLENESVLFFAVVKNLEIIGEAVYMLTKDFKDQHPEVNWQDYVKLRHVLVHGYYTINPHIVFDICEEDIKQLKPHVESYLGL